LAPGGVGGILASDLDDARRTTKEGPMSTTATITETALAFFDA
jgi:hypothetical protein